jgi:ribonuclease BN (tRNA processing enzyme)
VPELEAWLLGSGGWISTSERATTSVLVRDRKRALLVDAGTGLHRTVVDPSLLDGLDHIDIVLTHFHQDHVVGLAYLPALDVETVVWAPGLWLYGSPSKAILAPLLQPPLSPFEVSDLPEIRELQAGEQQIGGFGVRARAQDRHWAPSAGIRIDDTLAVITDTGFDEGSVDLAHDVAHLLHEAWSPSSAPVAAACDATAADAAQVARDAAAKRLTLIHLNPRLRDQTSVLRDAQAVFPKARLGRDGDPLLRPEP